MRWSQSLAASVCDIAQGSPARTLSPASLQTGSARIPLGDFFEGSTPDKPLAVQVVRIGEELEIVALSAEASVEWQRILTRPSRSRRAGSGFMRDIWERCSAIFRPRPRFRKAAMRSRGFSHCSVCRAASIPAGLAQPLPGASTARLTIWSAQEIA